MDKRFVFGTFCAICSAVTSFLFGAMCIVKYFACGDFSWVVFSIIGFAGSLVMYTNRK